MNQQEIQALVAKKREKLSKKSWEFIWNLMTVYVIGKSQNIGQAKNKVLVGTIQFK